MPLILPSNSISDLGYEVDNSVRQDDGSSDYFNRTPSSATNQKTFTISLWCKRGELSSSNGLILQGVNTGNDDFSIYFASNDTLQVFSWSGSSEQFTLETTRLFRDTSAWYHIVVSVDTTQATASNRVKIYINGVQETAFDTENYPAQNIDLEYNDTSALWVGRGYGGFHFDGYLAEVVSIDGQQLDSTSFGEFDADTGIWKPIDVSGLTFGTNGFYLDFEDSGSLGADVSGNGNNFTVNNLTSIDQTTDTPTNNYATLNPLNKHASRTLTFSNGNTTIEASASNWQPTSGTIGVNTGKWFWEFSEFVSNQIFVGLMADDCNINQNLPYEANGLITYFYSGRLTVDGTETESYFTAISSQSDVVGVALDMTAGTYGQVQFYHNGSATGSAVNLTSHFANKFVMPFAMCNGTGRKVSINTGNPSFTISSGNSDGNGYGNFEYSVPSGYYALNTKNLAEYG